MRTPRRTERGQVASTVAVVVSTVAIVTAGVALVVTSGKESNETPVALTPTETPTATPTASATPSPTKKPKPKPKVNRSKTYVEVYNNSGITGLAGRTAAKITEAGWQVVGSDNWVGHIPADTVYHPPRLAREGKQLALDLGIDRVKESVEPMKGDRLTVILTG